MRNRALTCGASLEAREEGSLSTRTSVERLCAWHVEIHTQAFYAATEGMRKGTGGGGGIVRGARPEGVAATGGIFRYSRARRREQRRAVSLPQCAQREGEFRSNSEEKSGGVEVSPQHPCCH